MSAVSIELSRLGKLGKLLATGGQARVYTVPKLSLPDAPGALVYKQYKDGQAPPLGLHTVVAVRNRLDLPARTKLDSLAAWPLRVVQSGGQVTGVLMRLIPDSYFQSRKLPSGKKVKDPREIQNLFVDATRARFVGMPFPTPEERLLFCRDLAAAVHLVHRNELVFGDFNARNAMFRMPERPSIMLVDCDAVRIRGTAARQLNAPDWDPPEGPNALTQQTDRYKLGLFVLRCLSPGPQASTSRDPARADAVLDAEGRRLLRDALAAEPGRRPTAQDWGYYWEWRINGRRLAPPRQAALSTPPAKPPAPPPVRLRRDTAGNWVPVTGTGAGPPTKPAPTPTAAQTKGWRRGADGKWHPTT